MANGLEVITGALTLLGIRPSESSITADETSDGLISINNMMNELVADGIDIGFENLEDIQETIYVDDCAIGPIKALLAQYIAPEYSRVITPSLQRRIDKAPGILRTLVATASSEYPDSLPRGSGNELNYSSGDGDSAGNIWTSRFYSANRSDKCS